MKRSWVGVLAGLLSAACVNANSEPTYPLYGDTVVAVDETAILVGDVEEVDGVSVSKHGHRFALLPGCHTVTNVTTWGGNANDGAIMAHLPQIPFAIVMKTGRTYTLRISLDGPAGEGGRLKVTATEQDPDGNVTAQFPQGTRCPGGAGLVPLPSKTEEFQ